MANDDAADPDRNEARDDGPALEGADVHQLPCVPDPEAMRAMIAALFKYSINGQIELDWTTPAPGTKERVKLNNAQLFGLDDDSRENLVQFACELNARPSTNVYIGTALRAEGITIHAHAPIEQCISVAAVKIDCDDPGRLIAALALCKQLNMTPNEVIRTGVIPHLRGAIYWVLEEPAGPDRFAEIKALEQRMVKLFGSDKAAVDTPRIMRLAGSVAWPIKAGRELELTGIYVTEKRPAPYTVEELTSCLAKATPAAPAPLPQGVIDFNEAKPQLDVAGMLEDAAAPNRFHENMLPAVMSLIARGTPPDAVYDMLAGAIRMAGYNVEQRTQELAGMVRGAVKKAQPKLKPAPTPEQQAEEFPLIWLPDLLVGRPPEPMRVKGLMPLRGFGVLYGASQDFKSFIVNDLCLRVATGVDWCGRKVTPCTVVNIVMEGQYAYPRRVKAWVQLRGGELSPKQLAAAPYAMLPEVIDMLDLGTMQRLARRLAGLPGGPAQLITIDTVACGFGGGNENDQVDMNRFVRSCKFLVKACGAFVLGIHHTGKDPTRGERGSSVLPAAEDVRYRLTRIGTSMACDLLIEKCKDGEDENRKFRFNLRREVVGQDDDGDDVTSLVPVFDGEGVGASGAARTGSRERAIRDVLNDGPATLATIVARKGLDRRNAHTSLGNLIKKGDVEKRMNFYRLVGDERGEPDERDEPGGDEPDERESVAGGDDDDGGDDVFVS